MCLNGAKTPTAPSCGGAAVPCGPPPPPPPLKTGLGAKIDEEVSKSPTLTSRIRRLEASGWTISYGDKGKGSFADKTAKTITIDPNETNTNDVVQTLSHETGHALYTADPYVPPDKLTKAQYVDANTKSALKDEGEATISNIEVRNELLKSGGPDIGIAGAQSAKYDELYNKSPDPKDRDKLREEIGNEFANGEHPSTDPTKTYKEYYSQPFADAYDKLNPPPGKKP